MGTWQHATSTCWGSSRCPAAARLSLRYNPASISRRGTRLSASARKQGMCCATMGLAHFGFRQDFDYKYSRGEVIGSGSFGKVRIACDTRSGEKYAVKTIPKRFVRGVLCPTFVKRVQHEVDIYNRMGHSLNVACLYGAYEDAANVHLLLELCTGGQLARRVVPGGCGEREAATLIQEVLRAIAQCHAKDVIVRDVKPENFLFLHGGAGAPLKMVDFGMATNCMPGQVLKERVGTAAYVAPELLRQSYSLQADIWSAGVVAYELLAGRQPFTARSGSDSSGSSGNMHSARDLFRAVLYAPIDLASPPWNSLSAGAADLVACMLDRDAATRPSAQQCLDHHWLRGQALSGSSRGARGTLADTLVQRLQRFGTYGHLKQVSLRAVAAVMGGGLASWDLLEDGSVLPGLPPGVAELVARLDPLHRGRIPHSAATAVLRASYALSAVETRQLLTQFQVGEDDCFDTAEWVAALTDWEEVQASPSWPEWVEVAFRAFSDGGPNGGLIRPRQLEDLLCGDVCEFEDEVAAALREADGDGDGALGLDDFRALCAVASKDRLDLFESRRRPGVDLSLALGSLDLGLAQPLDGQGLAQGSTDARQLTGAGR